MKLSEAIKNLYAGKKVTVKGLNGYWTVGDGKYDSIKYTSLDENKKSLDFYNYKDGDYILYKDRIDEILMNITPEEEDKFIQYFHDKYGILPSIFTEVLNRVKPKDVHDKIKKYSWIF